MDKTYIDDQQVVARYVQGKLTGEELNAFEIYMLDNPGIVDEIEYAKGMQESLESAKHELFGAEASQSLAPSHTGFWLSRKHATAATVLLAVTLTFSAYLYRQTGGLQDEIEALQNPISLVEDVWLEPVRSARARVIESRRGTALVLRVDISATQARSYSAEIRGNGGDYLWTQSDIRPDGEQSIRLLLSNLPPGEYRLFVTASDSAGSTTPVDEYLLSLRQTEE